MIIDIYNMVLFKNLLYIRIFKNMLYFQLIVLTNLEGSRSPLVLLKGKKIFFKVKINNF